MTGPRHSMALQYIHNGYNMFGAVGTVVCGGSRYRALSFIPEVYLLSLAPTILQEPSSKLPCLFILWIHRNWLDRNCLLHVHTETESGFRFETETGFDKWITPSVFIQSTADLKKNLAKWTSCVDHKDRNDMWPTAAFAYSFTMPTVLQSIQKNFTQSMWLAKRV